MVRTDRPTEMSTGTRVWHTWCWARPVIIGCVGYTVGRLSGAITRGSENGRGVEGPSAIEIPSRRSCSHCSTAHIVPMTAAAAAGVNCVNCTDPPPPPPPHVQKKTSDFTSSPYPPGSTDECTLRGR